MAGIGFEIRKILRRRSYLALLQAYGYAGLVSSGPWLLSIFGILLLGVLAVDAHLMARTVVQFQVSVTYLIAGSLIFTGPVQLIFTRFIADMLFARHRRSVVAVTFLTLAGTLAAAALLALLLAVLVFTETSWAYRLWMGISFVELCAVWILTIMATGLKDYKALVFWYLLSYLVIVGLGFVLGLYWGLLGFLGAFALGQAMLIISLGSLIIHQFPGYLAAPAAALGQQRRFWALSWVGFFFNVAIWADKLLFWFTPDTSAVIIGPLRASPIYDVPIFLSYLLIVPGLAIFLFRLETDFVEAYDAYNRAIIGGGIFQELAVARQGMIDAVRLGLIDIAKIQGMTVVLAWVFAAKILSLLGYSPSYARIFQFDVLGVSLQLLFMSILNVYFYLDRRRRSVLLTFLFLLGNLGFTTLTLWLGPFYYGAGFMTALLVVDVFGLWLLRRDMEDLDFATFVRRA